MRLRFCQGVLLTVGCTGPLHLWPLDRGPVSATPVPATVVVLPFGNVSGIPQARGVTMPLVRARLERAGYLPVPDEAVEAYLEKKRVRYLDAPGVELLAQLARDLSAAWVVTGAIFTWREGPHPVVAMEVRLLSVGGRTAWWNVVGLAPEDTAGILGLGRRESHAALLEAAVEELLRRLPGPGQRGQIRAGRSSPTLGKDPTVFRGPTWPPSPVRVCVLPFENRTRDRRASWIVGELLTRRLLESGRFAVVSPSDLRAALVAENFNTLWGLQSDQLRAVGARLGTSLFLHGAVLAFDDASDQVEGSPVAVHVELTLVDVERERILWAAEHQRRGEDYEIAFGRGAISEVVMLADQVLAEVVRAEGVLADHPLPIPVLSHQGAASGSGASRRDLVAVPRWALEPDAGPSRSDAGVAPVGFRDGFDGGARVAPGLPPDAGEALRPKDGGTP